MGLLDVYMTHLIADYSDATSRDEYHAHRCVQAFEMAHFIAATARAGLTLVLGDLNAAPSSVELRVLRAVAGLRDAFVDARGELALGPTISDPGNTYGGSGELPALRIDYVLWAAAAANFRLVDSRVYKRSVQSTAEHLASVVPAWAFPAAAAAISQHVSISDHWGVQAELAFSGAAAAAAPSGVAVPATGDMSARVPAELADDALALVARGLREALQRQQRHFAGARACLAAALAATALELPRVQQLAGAVAAAACGATTLGAAACDSAVSVGARLLALGTASAWAAEAAAHVLPLARLAFLGVLFVLAASLFYSAAFPNQAELVALRQAMRDIEHVLRRPPAWIGAPPLNRPPLAFSAPPAPALSAAAAATAAPRPRPAVALRAAGGAGGTPKRSQSPKAGKR
jgi:hypothetical protein